RGGPLCADSNRLLDGRRNIASNPVKGPPTARDLNHAADGVPSETRLGLWSKPGPRTRNRFDRRRVQHPLTPSEGCLSLRKEWQGFLKDLEDAEAGVCDDHKKRAARLDDDAGRCLECRARKSSLGDFSKASHRKCRRVLARRGPTHEGTAQP